MGKVVSQMVEKVVEVPQFQTQEVVREVPVPIHAQESHHALGQGMSYGPAMGYGQQQAFGQGMSLGSGMGFGQQMSMGYGQQQAVGQGMSAGMGFPATGEWVHHHHHGHHHGFP